MGMKDQFQDKAKDLADKAKDKMGQGESSERGAQRDEVSERVQREEDRMDQDYDA